MEDWGDGSVGNLLSKHEDLASNPQHSHEKKSHVACNPRTRRLTGAGGQSASLPAKQRAPGSMRVLSEGITGWRVIKGGTYFFLRPPSTHPSTCAHMYIHHTHNYNSLQIWLNQSPSHYVPLMRFLSSWLIWSSIAWHLSHKTNLLNIQYVTVMWWSKHWVKYYKVCNAHACFNKYWPHKVLFSLISTKHFVKTLQICNNIIEIHL